MNSDRIEGAVEKAAGKAQEAAGKVLGDRGMEARGVGRQFTGEARYRYGEANDQLKTLACEAVECVQRNPLTSLAVVGLVGFLIGAACRSVNRD